MIDGASQIDHTDPAAVAMDYLTMMMRMMMIQ